MPKFQKLNLVDDKITFRVICDDGHEEVQTYVLNGKTEDELMGEVALHIQSEKDKMQALNEASQEPVMEVSVSDGGKVSVKEASTEPIE